MSVEVYLSKQDPAQRDLLSFIHTIVVKHNKRVTPEVSKMMGQEMIQYKIGGMFMYGLGVGKGHMTLHLLPMYGSPTIHTKYKNLLGKAKFQKGCINFTKPEQMPLDIVEDLVKDCVKCEDAIIKMYKERHKK
jgi:hypothetical protein